MKDIKITTIGNDYKRHFSWFTGQLSMEKEEESRRCRPSGSLITGLQD